MSFFNRPHAAQVLEILAGTCGLFAFLATGEALATSGASERSVWLLIAGTGALSAATGLAGKRPRIALRALLVGPFIGCVMLAAAIPFTDHAVSIYESNPLVAALAFAAAALVLFVSLRALREP